MNTLINLKIALYYFAFSRVMINSNTKRNIKILKMNEYYLKLNLAKFASVQKELIEEDLKDAKGN